MGIQIYGPEGLAGVTGEGNEIRPLEQNTAKKLGDLVSSMTTERRPGSFDKASGFNSYEKFNFDGQVAVSMKAVCNPEVVPLGSHGPRTSEEIVMLDISSRRPDEDFGDLVRLKFEGGMPVVTMYSDDSGENFYGGSTPETNLPLEKALEAISRVIDSVHAKFVSEEK